MTYTFQYKSYEADSDNPQTRELPTSGTLEEALAIAREEGVTIKLTDAPGFPRGIVYASGDYTLT